MIGPTLTPGAIVALGAAAVAALYLLRGQASNVAAGAVGAVVDAGAGAVLGVGDAFGVPRTSATQCQQDIAAGRTWDASFSCPAGTFISQGLGGAVADAWGSLWAPSQGSAYLSDSEAIDARNLYAMTDPRRVNTGGASGSW